MSGKSPDELLDDLVAGLQFSLTYADKRDLLLPLLTGRAVSSAEGNAAVARYQRALGFAPEQVDDYDRLPALPVAMFKEFDLATVPPKAVARTLLSSATTGQQPSRVPLDKVTGKRQARGLAAILKDELGGSRRPFLVLDVPQINEPGAELAARGAAVRGIMPFATETVYALRREGSGFALDRAALEGFFAGNAGREVLVFGFTYLVWTEVVQKMRAAGLRFAHPEMILLHSGGWKRLTDQAVGKDEFAAGVGEVFGCAPDRVRDFYGMVEQVGVVFVDCAAGHKHSPAFAEVGILDCATLRQVEPGRDGLIQVMSALPSSYPGYALLTEDVGTLLGYDDCPCGRKGLYFRFRSRVRQVETRGCGDTVAVPQVVRLQPAAPAAPVAAGPPAAGPVAGRITHLAGTVLPAGRDDPQAVFAGLRDELAAAPVLPAGARVALLAAAAEQLLDRELAGSEGVAFLAAWLARPNLERVLATNFGERRAALDGAIPDAGSAVLAAPRGVVGHWVAGNVPTLAVFSWALAFLAGNRSIVRVARESADAAGRLFRALSRVSCRHEGRRYGGEDLLAGTCVLHLPSRDHDLNAAMSLACDARCIWGGSEAVAAVTALPGPEHAEDLVFGPKFSLAVMDRRQLADPEQAAALARTLARQVVLFDQAACSSPQVLFLEGAVAEHTGWLDELHRALARETARSPRRGVDETTAAAILRRRGRYGLGEGTGLWVSSGTAHTLLAADGAELPEAVQGRTLLVQGVADLLQVPPLLSPKIQTIGVAVAEARLRDEFCAAAARQGVARCVPLAEMNFFETPWDGMLPLSRLVRWVRVPLPEERS